MADVRVNGKVVGFHTEGRWHYHIRFIPARKLALLAYPHRKFNKARWILRTWHEIVVMDKPAANEAVVLMVYTTGFGE